MKIRWSSLATKRLAVAAMAAALLILPAQAADLFWTETGGFVVGEGSVWTAPAEGGEKTALATELSRPIGIDIDPANGHVYWAEDGWEGAPSRIIRANLDGSDPTTLFSENEDGFTNAQMLRLDLENGHVYWTDYHLGVIRGNLDGTGYTELGGSGEQYTAMDLDLINNHIYYGDPTQNGVLFRMDLDGGNDIEIVGDIVADDFRFNALALDAANGRIYYTDTGTHEIRRMSTDGSDDQALLSDPELAPFGVAIGPDTESLYWVGGAGRLGTADIDGANPTLDLVEIGETPFGIVVAELPDSTAEIRITEMTLDDSTVTVHWEGGNPPYQLQRRADLSDGRWEDTGEPTTMTEASDSTGADRMFYRVRGN